MTPNQRKVLKAVGELEANNEVANVYAVSGAVRVSTHYAEDLLKVLVGDGYVTSGPYRREATRYKLTEKGKQTLRPKAV